MASSLEEFRRNSLLLGFHYILEEIESYAQTEIGKEFVRNIAPKTLREVEEEFNIIEEVLKLPTNFDLNEFYDFRRELTQTADLLEFQHRFFRKLIQSIRIFRQISAFFEKNKLNFPLLFRLAKSLYISKDLENLIDQAIDEYGDIRSSASSELLKIRMQMNNERNSILKSLSEIARKNSSNLQSQDIVVRNNRFCLQVKVEKQLEIPGIIHDYSHTQKTVFIEPMELISRQNYFTKLINEEREEIRRILKNIAREVITNKENLLASADIIGKIDFLLAKKEFILRHNCIRPQISQMGRVKIIHAINPILARTQKNVVPLDLILAPPINTVLISGPNAGGKTVALKTIGLLALMLSCGVFIPAQIGTELPFFEQIFAEIGDEQRIENNLSSFSAHILNLIRILKNANNKSLILIDEICASTDPEEGSALAFAILETICQKESMCFVTSHFSRLKSLVSSSSRMINAAMEFKGQPTYRLILNSWGISEALAISKKLGLDEEILSRAKNYLDSDTIELSEKLNKLNQELDKYHRLNQEINKQKIEYENLKRSYETKMKSLREYLKETRIKILTIKQKLLLDSQKKIENLIREIKATNASKETIINAKQFINNELKTINEELSALNSNSAMITGDFQEGEYVYSKTFNKVGMIAAKKGKNFQITFGNISIELPPSDLTKAEQPFYEVKLKTLNNITNFNCESVLNIRGLNKEEAQQQINKFLDNAYFSGLREIRIIHGKGKGILKDVLWEMLKKDERIEKYFLAEPNEGGYGATKIILKKLEFERR